MNGSAVGAAVVSCIEYTSHFGETLEVSATLVDATNTKSVLGKLVLKGRFLNEGTESGFSIGGDQQLPTATTSAVGGVDLSEIHDDINALEKKVVGQFRQELESERTKVLLTHALAYSVAYLLTYSLTGLLTHLLTYLLTHSPTLSLTGLLTHLLTHSLAYSLTYSLTHRFSML